MSQLYDDAPSDADAPELLFAHIRAPKKRAFLEALAIMGHVASACEAVPIARTTAYCWRRADPEFAAAFDFAKMLAGESLLDEAMRRARDGITRLKFDKHGDAIKDPRTGEYYVEHQYSDVLLIFLMKSLMPEQFGEKLTHQGPSGGAIEHQAKLQVEHVDDWYPKRRPTSTDENQLRRAAEIDELRKSMGQQNTNPENN